MATEKLANINDIPEEEGIVVMSVTRGEVALFKVNGTIYALENECPHAGGPLGEGEVKECIVTCPWHGWEFHIQSGKCLNAPDSPVKTIPITLIDEEIHLLVEES